MKRKLLRQFIRMSRNLFIGLIVQQTFFCTLIAADLPAQDKQQSIKDIYLTIDFEKESLAGVFKIIEKETGFSFVYNARTIDLKRELTLHRKNTSLMRILMDVSRESGLKFQRMNDHIHVGVRESNEDVTVEEKIVAQGTTVTGRVTSLDDGSTLPGVNVIIKGTAEGTVTDLEGNYSLEVQDGAAVLVFSSVGFHSQEVAVGAQTVINMVLSVDVKSLEEIVVIGYGQQEKINLTGAVGVIASKELKNRPVASVFEAMQGQVPGLNIVRTSGQPGNQGIQINIRGQSTFTENPVLTLVDGIPASLENINPNDIESISVLKDAASAAIYGSRATGGVILVTTKKGRSGSPQLSYNSTFSMQQPTRWAEKPSAFDYATIRNQASVNDGTALRFNQTELDLFASPEWSDYDWDDYLLNNAFQTNQNISISGGSEAYNYYLSIGYLYQDGVVINTGFSRFNIQLNQDFKIGKRLSAMVRVGYAPSTITEPAYDWDQLRFIYATPKTSPFRSDDGKWLLEPSHTQGGNSMANLSEDGGQALIKDNRLTGNFTVNYNILDNLKLTGTYGITSFNNWDRNYRKILTVYDPENTEIVAAKSVSNFLNIENSRSTLQNLNLIANYNTTFGDHKLDILAGVTREWYEESNEFVGTRDFLTDNIYVIDAGTSDQSLWNISGSAADNALQSVISRISYSFKGKYMLEGSMRYDGSSRFTEEVRWGFFPSVSAGWVASEENFLKDNNVLTFFKFRGSWGEVGNQNVGFYPFANRLAQGAYYFNGLPQRTVTTAGAPNPLLTWETKQTINFGFEGNLWDNLLGFTLDIFNERTNDILLQLPLPSTYGQPEPVQNAGRVDNKGWELELNHRNTVGKFGYGIAFQISNATSEVVDMGGVSPRISGNTITQEGRPMNEWFGFQADGFFQSQEEITAHALQSPQNIPGDIRYVDINDDGVINSEDRVNLGIADPRYPYGVRLNFSFRSFTLTAFGQGVGKHMVITRPWEHNTYRDYHMDYWTPDNPGAQFPAPRVGGGPGVGINKEFSSFWLENAAYFRLKYIEVGYSLPQALMTRLKVSNARVFISGENLLTFTNYLGYDPEVATGYGIRQVEARYPLTKLYSLGLNFNF
jgi:TonB-dependent starch-binding outer membrane protein SusC